MNREAYIMYDHAFFTQSARGSATGSAARFHRPLRAHKAPTPEPNDDPLPGEHPVPQEEPVPSPKPESHRPQE